MPAATRIAFTQMTMNGALPGPVLLPRSAAPSSSSASAALIGAALAAAC
jgi:hypothetical protein